MKLGKYIFIVAIALNLCYWTGCNRDRAYSKVTGVVSMNGEPLEECVLTFFPQFPDGEGGSGMTDAGGAYVVTSQNAFKHGTGLIPGKYKVTAIKNSEFVDEDQEAYERGEITYDELQDRKAGTYDTVVDFETLTPKQYLDPKTTPIEITVSKDPKQNVFNFTLD